MPKKRFTDEQIAFALRQADGGTPAGEICRKMGIAEATFYRWKKVYAGGGGEPCCAIDGLDGPAHCIAMCHGGGCASDPPHRAIH